MAVKSPFKIINENNVTKVYILRFKIVNLIANLT